MGDVLGELIPLAAIIALSPFPVIPTIMLMFTTRPRANPVAFLGGWIVGIGGATLVFVPLAAILQLPEYLPTWANWSKVVLGAALIATGAVLWFRRTGREKTPAWMQSISKATPSSAARLGSILSALNPKIVVLAAAAGLVLGASELGPSTTAVVLIVFTAIASTTVAIPVLLFLVLGERMLPPLAKIRSWMEANNAAFMAVVFVLIGLLLGLEGASAL